VQALRTIDADDNIVEEDEEEEEEEESRSTDSKYAQSTDPVIKSTTEHHSDNPQQKPAVNLSVNSAGMTRFESSNSHYHHVVFVVIQFLFQHFASECLSACVNWDDLTLQYFSVAAWAASSNVYSARYP